MQNTVQTGSPSASIETSSESTSPPVAASPPAFPAALPGMRSAELPRPPEFGGPTGPEPTRYGDWEKKGRCIDF